MASKQTSFIHRELRAGGSRSDTQVAHQPRCGSGGGGVVSSTNKTLNKGRFAYRKSSTWGVGGNTDTCGSQNCTRRQEIINKSRTFNTQCSSWSSGSDTDAVGIHIGSTLRHE